MPYQQPKTLTNDEVYALTAYLLALNKLIGENETMNAQTLPKAALFPLVLALYVISAYVLNNTMALRSRRSSWARSLATRSRSTWCDRS